MFLLGVHNRFEVGRVYAHCWKKFVLSSDAEAVKLLHAQAEMRGCDEKAEQVRTSQYGVTGDDDPSARCVTRRQLHHAVLWGNSFIAVHGSSKMYPTPQPVDF